MLKNRFNQGLLMAPVATAGGEGGGGGAGGGLTMDAVAVEIDKRIGTHFEKFRSEGLAAEFDSRLKPITDSLEGIMGAVSKLAPQGSGNNGGGASGTGAGSHVPPEVNVKIQGLTETTMKQGKEIETLKKERDEAASRAEKSERHSVIRTALTNLSFVNDAAQTTAFGLVEPHIRRMEDGSLIGGVNGDNFPVDHFVKEYIAKDHNYLLRGSGASGSGAGAGGANGPRFGVRADINDIKTGMKPETREAVVAAIVNSLPQ